MKKMITLMTPLILCNILQQLYNTVDALVIGRFADENAFAAVGIASSVMNLFLFAIVGACAGISVLFAQRAGSGDMDAFRKKHFETFALGLPVSAALTLAGTAALRPLEYLINVPASLEADVSSYLIIVLLGLPASYLYNLYSAILRAVSRAGAILGILAVCVCANFGLDILLVGVVSMGIRGAAVATVISQCLSAFAGFLYMRGRAPHLMFTAADAHPDREQIRATISIASVTAIHQTGLYIGKLLVQGVVNDAGTSVIAAYTATTRIEGFANSFGDSGAAATSVITANAFGARDKNGVRSSFRISLLVLAVLGAAMSLIMYVSAAGTSALLIGSASGSAYESSVSYLKLVSVFYTFCFIGNTYAGWFDGVGKVHIPFIGAASHITMRIILSWLLIGRMGLTAVALATGAGWCWVCVFWEFIRRRRFRAGFSPSQDQTGVSDHREMLY